MKNTVSLFDQDINLLGILSTLKTSIHEDEIERVFHIIGGRVYRPIWTYSGQQIWDTTIVDTIPTILGGFRR